MEPSNQESLLQIVLLSSWVPVEELEASAGRNPRGGGGGGGVVRMEGPLGRKTNLGTKFVAHAGVHVLDAVHEAQLRALLPRPSPA